MDFFYFINRRVWKSWIILLPSFLGQELWQLDYILTFSQLGETLYPCWHLRKVLPTRSKRKIRLRLPHPTGIWFAEWSGYVCHFPQDGEKGNKINSGGWSFSHVLSFFFCCSRALEGGHLPSEAKNMRLALVLSAKQRMGWSSWAKGGYFMKTERQISFLLSIFYIPFRVSNYTQIPILVSEARSVDFLGWTHGQNVCHGLSALLPKVVKK
jgi:hypothetical protein